MRGPRRRGREQGEGLLDGEKGGRGEKMSEKRRETRDIKNEKRKRKEMRG